MALTGKSSIGEWLDSSTGGPLARAMLAEFGVDEEKVRPYRSFAVELIVPFSKGRVSAAMLEELVQRARAAESAQA